jgi:cbb3-type cytochrome oxidase subunit 3
MDTGTLYSIVTVIAFATFIAIIVWAWSGSRKARFEEDALLPFDEDEPARDTRRTRERGDG